MSVGHDKLKSIGAQKIHETTHISRLHIQAVIHESYDDMSKIQFLGFISILEREYDINLDELKDRGLSYFGENTAESHLENNVFVTSKKKTYTTLLYAFFAVIIFVIVSYFSINFEQSIDIKNGNIDNSTIKNARANIELNTSSDLNESLDENITIVDEKQYKEKKTFIITPTTDVWLGYVDLNTHKKFQATITKSFELNASKSWLLTFGHGYFTTNINGIEKKYSDKKTIRFIYKDLNMTKITYTEWKKLDEGSKW